MREIELKPIKETPEDYDKIRDRILELFRQEIYLPLLKEINISSKTLKNAKGALVDALGSGRIHFYRGQFKGKFNASVSKELQALGAKWDKKTLSFNLPLSQLPIEIKNAIYLSEERFKRTLQNVDKKLSEFLPDQIADKLKIEKYFDSALFKVEKEFKKSVKGITVAPSLTQEQRIIIAEEYTDNLKLKVQDWTGKQVTKLRALVQERTFSGLRREGLIGEIMDNYGASYDKAKFLAKQETSLLMAKFKETRYQEAGVNFYKWRSVAGSAKHPVRPRHKFLSEESLKGKLFKFDDPPITTEPGAPVRRNNPGEDYGCRCTAVPVIRV